MPTLTFELSDALEARLKKLAEDEGIDIAEVLGDGIALAEAYYAARREGGHLETVSRRGRRRGLAILTSERGPAADGAVAG